MNCKICDSRASKFHTKWDEYLCDTCYQSIQDTIADDIARSERPCHDQLYLFEEFDKMEDEPTLPQPSMPIE